MGPTEYTASRPLREYTYSPITSPNTTRILLLHPARNSSDALSGALCPLKLPSDSADRKPNGPARPQSQPYEALSYLWGDPTATETITLGGDSSLYLTSNIADALRRVRLPGRARAVWADQVCVNQRDKAERSQQVKLMGSLYRSAEHVLVWLGRDPMGSAGRARRLIGGLDELFSRAGGADGDEGVDYEKALCEFPAAQWTALSELNWLQYFGRVWITQEIGGPKPAQLFWGSDCPPLDWEQLVRVVRGLSKHGNPQRRRYKLSPTRFFRLHGWFEDGSGPDDSRRRRRRRFIYNLVIMRHQQASDGRDFVYALLGHWTADLEGTTGPDGKAAKIIEVDYTKTKAEVYREVAIATLKGQGGSSGPQDLLTLNTVRHRPGWDRPGDLREFPSWVTQWDDGARQNVIPLYDTFSASGTRGPADLAFSADGRVLTLQGVVVDTIDSVSGEIPAENFRSVDLATEGGRLQHAATVRELFLPWRELCGPGGELDTGVEYRPAVEDGAVRSVGRAAASALWAYMETVSGMLFKDKKWAHRAADTRAAHMAAYLVGAFPQKMRANGDASILELAKKGDAEVFTTSVYIIAQSMRFATTVRRGLYVLAPTAVEQGDVLCVLFGGATPYILRRRGSRWLLVGECFAYGMMFGEGTEMLERGEVKEMSFDIV